MEQALVNYLSIFVNVVVVIFCLGAVPFCINVVKKLSIIETTLKQNEWQERALNELTTRVHHLELIIASCDSCKKSRINGQL